MVRHRPKERHRLRAPGVVDATRRLSPFGCARGRFDAPSTRRGPHDACCRRASSEARSARIVLERPLQKLAFGIRNDSRTRNGV